MQEASPKSPGYDDRLYHRPSPPRRTSPFGLSVTIPPHADHLQYEDATNGGNGERHPATGTNATSPATGKSSPNVCSLCTEGPHTCASCTNKRGVASGLAEAIDLGPPLGPDTPSSITFDRITKLPTPVIKQGLFSSTFSGHSALLNSSPGGPAFSSPSTLDNTHEDHEAPMVPVLPPGVQLRDKGFRAISEYKPAPIVSKNVWNEIPKSGKRVVSTPTATESEVSAEDNRAWDPLSGKQAAATESQTLGAPQVGDIYTAPHSGAQYQFQKQIGSGTFSTVVLATNVVNPLDAVAVKIVQVPLRSEREAFNFKAVIRRELNALRTVHHPCIVRLVDYSVSLPLLGLIYSDLEDLDSNPVSPTAISLVYNAVRENNEQILFLSYSQGGNLYQMQQQLRKTHGRSIEYWRVVQRMVAELVCAVATLHAEDVVHRDIKLENVLVNREFGLLVGEGEGEADFGGHSEHPGGKRQDGDSAGDYITANKGVARDAPASQSGLRSRAVPSSPTPSSSSLSFSFSSPLIALADFGLSRRLRYPSEFLTTRCGSQDYVSPELLLGIPYDGKLTDAWAVGVVVYALLENRLPFDVPPVQAPQHGISPLVLKRRRNKNTAAHRIAMLSWDWFTVLELASDEEVPQEAKDIVKELRLVVELLLVRKDRRLLVRELCLWKFMELVPEEWKPRRESGTRMVADEGEPMDI